MHAASTSGMDHAGQNYDDVVMPSGVEENYWTWTVPGSTLEAKYGDKQPIHGIM